MKENINFHEELNKVIKAITMVDMMVFSELKSMQEKGLIEIKKNEGVAYTDGRKIALLKNFFERNVKERLFILLHELLHIKLNHFTRFKGVIVYRGKKISIQNLINIATDLAINDSLRRMILENNKFKNFISIPSDALLPSIFNLEEGRSAEFYLSKLLENLDKLIENMNKYKNFDEHGESQANESSDNNGGDSDNNDNNSGGDNSDNNNDNVIIIKDKEDIEKVKEEIAKRLTKEEQEIKNKISGKGDNLINRIINRILGSNSIAWREIIRSDLFTFKKTLSLMMEEKIDKKNLARNIRVNGLPTVVPMIYKRKEINKINVNVFVDTSGSISQKELEEFLFQIIRIVDEVDLNTLNIYLFSDGIYYQDAIEIKDNKEKAKEKIEEIAKKIRSGGTSFEDIAKVFNSTKENAYFVIFTDGYADKIDIKSSRNKRLIWIITNNRSFEDKYNRVIHIEV